MDIDIIARGMAGAAKESILADYSELSSDVSGLKSDLVDVKNDSYISSDIVFEDLTLNSKTVNSTVSGNLMTIPKDTNCGGSYFGYRCNVSDTVKGKTIEVKISFDDTINQSFSNKNYTVYTILTNNEGVSLVEVKNNNGIVTYVVDIDYNATARYIVFVCQLAYYGTFSAEQSITVNDYSVDVYTNNQRVNIKIDNAIDEKTKGINSNYVGKQLACFGDSYTAQAKWQPYVVEKLFLSGFYGFSQSGGTLTSIYTEISGLNTNSDIVTIWIGTNDYHGNRKIGTLLDDVSDETIKDAWGYTTFCGALNYVCNWLSTNMSGKTIVFITPTYRHDASDDTRLTDYGKNDKGYILNGFGASLEDYANAMIMVSSYWGFPCLDLFHNSGINEVTYPSFYQSDRLHPSDDGAEKLARKIAMFINMN